MLSFCFSLFFAFFSLVNLEVALATLRAKLAPLPLRLLFGVVYPTPLTEAIDLTSVLPLLLASVCI
tara:strand:+ start:94 stop:291 length:198 start_codon:yes stop_codon:yes gene_type:complete